MKENAPVDARPPLLEFLGLRIMSARWKRAAVVLLAGGFLLPLLWAQTLDRVPAIVYDNLTEAFARKTYGNPRPTSRVYKGISLQTELLHFTDQEYGTQIWRLTYSNNGSTYVHNHINRSPWNADGSKIGMISDRCFPPFWCNGTTGDPMLYLVDTDGSNFSLVDWRTCPGCTAGNTRFRHWVWDRTNPNYAYFAAKDGLYYLDVRRLGTYTKVADLPNTNRSKVIYSYPSESNIVMVIDDLNNNYPDPMFYFVDLNKLGQSGAVTSYPIAFNLNVPGHDKSLEWSFHDIYFTRRPDNTYTFNYGPIGDVGEYLFFMAPLSGNATDVTVWFDNSGTNKVPYHSHPAWGPNGTLTSYFGETYPYGSGPYGWNVANDATKQMVKMLGSYDGTLFGAGHIAWDGYDPDFIFCQSGPKLFRAHVSGPANNAEGFVNHYTGLNDGKTSYVSSPRPAQSPDATKILYHSTLTEASDQFADVYIAVARYPSPPMQLSLGSTSQPQLTWIAPMFHRETKGYHLYRSESDLTHFVDVSPSIIQALQYTDSGLVQGRDYYYAATSEEWSGLESRELSNIIKVTCNSGVYASTPVEGQGRTGFDLTPPPVVQGVTATTLESGVYQVKWTASASKDIWYYNIYYSVAGTPKPSPQRLIASVPKDGISYIDWMARRDAPAHYLVAAVDRQGNESSIAPLPPQNLRIN